MASVARELRRNPNAVFEVDRWVQVERSRNALAKRSVRDRILVRLLTDGETYAVELAAKVGVSRTAVIKAVDELEEKRLVITHMETELPEQLKRPQRRRITLTAAGKERATAIQTELDNEPSPFDELWGALRASRMAPTRMGGVRSTPPAHRIL